MFVSLLIVVFFVVVELRVQRSPDGPRLAVVTTEDSCFCCRRVGDFAIIVLHKRAPEARWDSVPWVH